MHTRIKELRKHLGLSQSEFGEPLGISQSGVTWLENGQRGITNRTVAAICFAYGVSEQWLRDGTGPMFVQRPEAEEMAELLGEALPENLDPVRANLIRLNMMLIRNLPDDILPEVESYIIEIADSIKKGKEEE